MRIHSTAINEQDVYIGARCVIGSDLTIGQLANAATQRLLTLDVTPEPRSAEAV